jgi:hypothetical protein
MGEPRRQRIGEATFGSNVRQQCGIFGGLFRLREAGTDLRPDQPVLVAQGACLCSQARRRQWRRRGERPRRTVGGRASDAPSVNDIIVIGDKLAGDAPASRRVIAFSALVERGSAADPEVIVEDRDPISYIYTSGTASAPKGVVSNHLAVYLPASRALGRSRDRYRSPEEWREARRTDADGQGAEQTQLVQRPKRRRRSGGRARCCNHSVQREPAVRINWRGWSTPPA